MVIQTGTQISLTPQGTDNVKNIGVSVQNVKDDKISGSTRNVTMDGTVQQDKGSSTVYTEAEARQLHMETAELPDVGSMSPADFISQCMTGEDAQALSGEGTPLEEYTSSQLERAVSRVKEQRSEKRQAVENQVAKEEEEKEALEQTAISNAAGTDVPDKVLRQLEESDLPVTSESVARLVHAVDLAAERQQLSQDSVKFFIGNQQNITPENISGSVYGGAGNSGTETEEDSSFSSVASQVETILQEGGLPLTEESMETAKWLYDSQLPVTAENIRLCGQLEEIRDMDVDTLIERIADQLVDGVAPEKADLTVISRDEADTQLQEFIQTDEDALRQAYPAEIDFIRAKRQMEEIRLSMTAEAARTMAAKGIDLDLSNIEKIVGELREQEQQAKESWLLETGLPVTDENLNTMAGTLDAAKNVMSAPVELLANTIPRADSITLSELSDSALTIKEQYDRMEQTYEAVGTEVRRDLGDSIQKAFGNVDEILKDLGLETTAVNQRAVRILGYNQMELTEENVQNMKAYDSKVTTLMDNLKPPVVAELIRRDINPLELSVDELNQKVDEISSEVASEDISFRKFMWKMDHQGEMSQEERQSMIGVYRLLDKINKSDGAVIGQVVKEGRELSLSSLLSATRTRKAEGMDVSVDDDFGGLEDTVTHGVSIDEQIQTAYQSSVAEKLQKTLSPKVLQNLGQDGMEISLESLLEEMQEAGETPEEMEAYYQQMAQEISAAMEDPEGEMLRFLESLELPDTAMNRLLAKSYMENGMREYLEPWDEEESQSVQETFDEPEQLDALYEKLDEAHKETLEKKRESDDIAYDDVISLAKMAGSISFYRHLRARETYEVPIVTEQGITTCNVTIQSENAQKGTVEISMDSADLGKIQATFRLSGKHVKGFVTAERGDQLDACGQILERFEKDLEENGFTMDSDNLVQGNRRSLRDVNDKVEGAKNKDLYQVAKCFIINVTGKDDEYAD
jgi:hypothetical protein